MGTFTGRKMGQQESRSTAMSTGQKLGSVAVGVSIWLVFVFVVRSIPWAFDGGFRSALLFLATVPITWASVLVVKRAAALTSQTVFEGVVLATVAAMFLDGFVFTFLSGWYGNSEEHIRHGAGFILWGAAMGILIAWLMYTPNASKR